MKKKERRIKCQTEMEQDPEVKDLGLEEA